MQEDWNPHDHAGMRRRIEEGTVAEWQRVFPLEYGGVRMEADNYKLTGKDRHTLKDQKKAWMENKPLKRTLKADVRLFDSVTNEKLDERPGLAIMSIPHYTNRGTFVYNGNNFSSSIQSRLIPGVYTRRQNNGALESTFNVRSGTGRVFRIGLDPEDGQFRFRMAGSNLHLYSLLRDIGVSDDELADAWGPDVLDMNRKKYDARAVSKLYQKAVPSYDRAEEGDLNGRNSKIISAFDKAQVAQAITDRTLGAYWRKRSPEASSRTEHNAVLRSILDGKLDKKSAFYDLRTALGDEDDEGDRYHPVGIDGMLAATRKLLAVNRGQDETDERNIPAAAKLYPMDKLLREKIRLDAGNIRKGAVRLVANRRNLDSFRPHLFDSYYMEMITHNPMTSPIEETNPLQLFDQQRRVTSMGPGGIGSSEAISADMQSFQMSEMGFFSPVEGPECFTGEAQVYTRTGWLAWDETDDDTEYLTIVEEKTLWNKGFRIVSGFEGMMVRVCGKNVLLYVTPNHRMLLHKELVDVFEPAYSLRDTGPVSLPAAHGVLKACGTIYEAGKGAAVHLLDRSPVVLLDETEEIRRRAFSQIVESTCGARVGLERHVHLSEERAAVFERLAVELGYPARLSSNGRGMTVVCVNTRMSFAQVDTNAWTSFSFSGTVYCARVPGSRLLVRQTESCYGIWTGNSERAGVDVRLANGVKIGADGRMRRPFLDGSGASVLLSPHDLVSKTVGFPD